MPTHPTRPCWIPLVGAASALLLLAGCASQTPTDVALEREAALHERAETRISERETRQSGVIDSIPAWIIKTPSPDATGLYGAGIGTSTSLSLALQKANIDARRSVAQEINQTLSAESTLAGDGDASFQSIVNTFVDSVNVAGAEDVERVIQSGREGYRVYSLIKLPFPDFNRALTAFTDQNGHAGDTLRAQYQQLMERVDGTPRFDAVAPSQNASSEPDPHSEGRRPDAVVSLDGDMPDEALVRALQQP